VPGVKRLPDLALRFVLANPNVSIALSGMSTMEQVEENLATAADEVSLTEEDSAAIDEHLERLKEMAKLYCTGCGYCLPCPNEVAIPKIFERYNLGRVYGLWEAARSAYARLGTSNWDKGSKADACVECGECEDKCPQDIPIREQLKEAHAALTGEEETPST
jgi:predicted aldo/keto reductase-like oxidoreductase